MNYTSAAVGAIMAIAAVTWFVTGRRQFSGPVSGGVVIEGAPGVERDGEVEAEAEEIRGEKGAKR